MAVTTMDAARLALACALLSGCARAPMKVSRADEPEEKTDAGPPPSRDARDASSESSPVPGLPDLRPPEQAPADGVSGRGPRTVIAEMMPTPDGGTRCFEARFDEHGMELAAGVEIDGDAVVITTDGTRYRWTEQEWRPLSPDAPPSTPRIPRVVRDEGGSWHLERHVGVEWRRASPGVSSEGRGFPSVVGLRDDVALLTSPTHVFLESGGVLRATARTQLRRVSIGRLRREDVIVVASEEGLVASDGVSWWTARPPLEPTTTAPIVSRGQRPVLVSDNRLVVLGEGPLPSYTFELSERVVAEDARVDAVLGGRLIRVEREGARTQLVRVATGMTRPWFRANGGEARDVVTTETTLFTLGPQSVVRCDLDGEWTAVQPIELDWRPGSPLPYPLRGAPESAYYAPTDPRYAWPPEESPYASLGARFDARGRLVHHARYLECSGDGCSQSLAAIIAPDGRVVRSSFGPGGDDPVEYRAIRDRFEEARPGMSALARMHHDSRVVTLTQVLPRWMLYLRREGEHDVLRLVDPENRRSTVLARAPAEGTGQCWEEDECVPCPGEPRILNATLSPDGGSLFVERGVYGPACSCHTTMLYPLPMRASVLAMRAFARGG